MTADEKRERRKAKHEFHRALTKNISLHFPDYAYCATSRQLKEAVKQKAEQLASQLKP